MQNLLSLKHSQNQLSKLLSLYQNCLVQNLHLYCQVGDNEFIAKVDARDYLGTGETIELGFDLNKAHFFDKETEKTVY